MIAAEIKFLALVSILLVLAVGIIFDPFNTVSYSYRTGGALILGPMSLSYGILGLARGRFPEMVDAAKDGIRWKFWFCASTFILLGLATTLVGLEALGLFGS